MRNWEQLFQAYVRLSQAVRDNYIKPDDVLFDDLRVTLAYVQENVEREIEASDPGGYERLGQRIREFGLGGSSR